MTIPLLSVPAPAAPIGGPLPDSRSGRLFPSSALASGFALAAYALAALILPHFATAPKVIDVPYRDRTFDVLDEPGFAPRPPAAPRREERAAPAEPLVDPVNATPVPVPDHQAEPSRWDAGAHVAGEASGPSAVPGEGAATGSGAGADPYFIYHEVAPVLLHAPKPEYPDLAWQAGVDGMVIVRAYVGVDGRVTRAEVLRSVPLLDAAAVDAAMRMRFRPAEVSGRPVAVWVSVPIRFSLH